jgi:ubiquinone/menaquinone biosynthesis C-methylase UbiE
MRCAPSSFQAPYDKLASRYDRRAFARSSIVGQLLLTNNLLRPNSVLDLGIGTGLVWKCVQRHHAFEQIVGIDLSFGMLARARENTAGAVRLVRASIAALPFRASTFNTVMMAFSARHVEKLDEALQSVSTAMSKNGRLILVDYSTITQLALAGLVLRAFEVIDGIIPNRPLGIPQSSFRACPEEELIAAARAAGFQTEQLLYHSILEAQGRESVLDFVLESPPLAFELSRFTSRQRLKVRKSLLADCSGDVLPARLVSRVFVCVMKRPQIGTLA